jgi:hypothetical protein
MKPLTLLEVADRDGNTLEQHRGTIPGDASRHGAHHDKPAPGRNPAWHRLSRHGRREPLLGGKIGTTDDYSTPGSSGSIRDHGRRVDRFRLKRPIGNNQTDAVAALPIWREIMTPWITGKRRLTEPPVFERPGMSCPSRQPAARGVHRGTEPGAK